MKFIKNSPDKPKNQHGMSTLLMSTVLIFVISMISVYAAQISVMEQKISANHYRGKQAFESAQSGLEIALSQLDFQTLDTLITAGTPTLEHTAVNATLTDYAADSALANIVGANNNGQYRLKISREAGATNNDTLVFTSYGFADDVVPENDNSNASQTITMKLKKTKYINYEPPSNLVALGDIRVTGSRASLINATGDPMAVLWTAGSATVSGATTVIATNSAGSDSQNGIYDNDSDLIAIRDIADSKKRKERLFQNFFAQSKSNLKNRATVIDCKTGCTQSILTGLSGIVWVDAHTEATFSEDGTTELTPASYETLAIVDTITLGSTTNPIVLIVDGKLTMHNPDAHISGVIYTTQDFANGNGSTARSGSGNITGSLITEGSINIGGTLTMTYDRDMLVNGLANLAMYTRLPGSWIDI